jgi:hypothetical protein
VKDLTIKTFKDKPDEVTTVQVVHVNAHEIGVVWDTPNDNNSPILRYNVYLSTKRVRVNDINIEQQALIHREEELRKVKVLEASEERYFCFQNLDPGCCYYVVVTAVNKLGEGYKSKVMIMTLSNPSKPGSLFVWGCNFNSEIALTDDHVCKNISNYQASCLKKPIRNTLFEKDSVILAAAGSTQSVFVVVDDSNR